MLSGRCAGILLVELASRRTRMAAKVIVDREPCQLVGVMGMKLGRKIVGLVQQSDGDVDSVREIVVAARQR